MIRIECTSSSARPARGFLWTAALAGLWLGASCGASSQAHEREPADSEPPAAAFQGPAVICGTAIEASTGQPMAGVAVEGPGGVVGLTDGNGRFELSGLPTGLSGTLQASTDGGLAGENPLRPLSSGRLEVVIYLR